MFRIGEPRRHPLFANDFRDHFGTPLGVGPYAGKREDNFEKWKDDIAAVAEQKNVFAKLGGLAMPDNGFGWHERDRPPSSDEFVDAQAKYYHHTIACFGAERCMLESNFPVDRLSISFRTLWNGLKKITADYSEEEKSALFAGTARKVYRTRDAARADVFDYIERFYNTRRRHLKLAV